MTASRAVPQTRWVSPTRERKRSEFTCLCFGLGFLCLIGVVLAVSLTHRTGNGYATFGTLWASGKAAVNGLNPYTHYPETFHAPDYSAWDLNLNPPWTLPVLEALSHLTIEHFKQVWTVLTGLCFLAGGLILIARQPELQGRQILWLMLCAPAIATFNEGQIYAWPFLFGTLAWLANKKGHLLLAGLVVGIIVSLRPTMCLVLLLLLLAGHRKIAAAAIGSSFMLYVLPLVMYGPVIYVEWLHALADGNRHWIHAANIAIWPAFTRTGHPYIGAVIAVLLVLLVCGWAFRNRPEFTHTCGAGLCLGVACAPLAWFHYILFVAPFFMTRRWTALPMMAAALFLIRTEFSDTTRGILYLVATLMILASFVRGRYWLSFVRPRIIYDPPPIEAAEIVIENA